MRHGQRGKEIAFVDIDAKEHVGTFEDWHRDHGHAQAVQVGAKKSHETSSRAKSKHQLGWPALQAKERQGELEQQWAAGAAAKRAAGARYGF